MRLRENLRARFRGLSEDEYVQLEAAALERRNLPAEEREGFGTPPEAESSIGGALLWSITVLWQDRPNLVLCGCAGALTSLLLRIIELF